MGRTPFLHSNAHPLPKANSGLEAPAGTPSVAQGQVGIGIHSLVLRSKLVPDSNKYLQRYSFMLASRMTIALHPLPQTAIPQIRLRAPLSLALFHKSENQVSCSQSRAHDFVGIGGVDKSKAKPQKEAQK